MRYKLLIVFFCVLLILGARPFLINIRSIIVYDCILKYLNFLIAEVLGFLIFG